LEKDNTLAQYLNLKSQIEPHFLFNSLSVLSSLIYSDKELASEFVLKLSRILRFVIEKNSFLLVPLNEEMTFIENYIFLIKTRFDDEVVFNSSIDEKKISSCYVPPASIQTLVENAIKHNKFSKESPLQIEVYNSSNRITVSNNVNLRNHGETSTGKGLDNLKARYSHFTSNLVEITQTEDSFTVSIPLLTKKEYESFNI
jgi:LytS/YehU family sensor histidine kinase